MIQPFLSSSCSSYNSHKRKRIPPRKTVACLFSSSSLLGFLVLCSTHSSVHAFLSSSSSSSSAKTTREISLSTTTTITNPYDRCTTSLAVSTIDPVELLAQPSLDEIRFQQQRNKDDLHAIFPISHDQRYKVNRRTRSRNTLSSSTTPSYESTTLKDRTFQVETVRVTSPVVPTTRSKRTKERKGSNEKVISSSSPTTRRIKISTKLSSPQCSTISALSSSTPSSSTTTTTTTTKKHSRSSTMPGFRLERSPLRKKSTTTAANGSKITTTATTTPTSSPSSSSSQYQHPAQTLYKQSPSVPDSMIQFTNEIHTHTTRITREDEITLGEKTQAAVRLQRQYEVLQNKLQREPTDEEWCAAAGKINMAALRETLEEGRHAKQQLVTSNLRMVQSVVNTYLRNGLSAQYNAGDLMQEGILALIKAAEKFEPQRGWKFSTYAMYWVRSSVKHNQIQQASVVWVPQRLHEQYKRLRGIRDNLRVQLRRTPTVDELAEAAGMSVAQVEHCWTSVQRQTVSLDAPVRNTKQPMKDDSSAALYDYLDVVDLDDQQNCIRQDLWETLHRHLDATQVELLWMRYGFVTPTRSSSSINEIARQVNMKPDQVRRILKKSLEQLRTVEEMEYFQRVLSI